MPQFIGAVRDPVDALRRLRVGLVGSGSLGGRIAEDLARAGVGGIWIIDPKAYKPESLLTHGIHPGEVGQAKAEAVAHRCKLINPAMRAFYCHAQVQDLPLDAFSNVDLVVLASDNLGCEMDLGERCHRLRRPLLQAAVHGESLTVVLRSFANTDRHSACPRCLFGAAEIAALEAETRFSCEPGSLAQPAGVAGPPTMSVSALCTLAAGMAGCQVVRWALGLGTAPADSVLEYNAYTHRTVIAPVGPQPDCPCEHQVWEVRDTPRRLADCSPRDLLDWAGHSTIGPATVLIDGFDWIDNFPCPCGAVPDGGRFVESTSELPALCPNCASPLTLPPFARAKAVSLRRLGKLAGQTFGQIGASCAQIVLWRADDRAWLFRGPMDE